MKNKSIFFILLFIFVFSLVPNVLGNVIDITPSTGLVRIGRWHEFDIIEGLDLKVNITLIGITIDKKIIQTNDYIEMTLNPEKSIGSGASKVENVTFGVINERTNKYVVFEQEYMPEHGYYKIKINPNNFNWSDFEDYQLLIRMNYSINNYIDDWRSYIFAILPLFKIPLDADKTVIIGTGCHPETACPKPKSISKEIYLPKEIILRTYTEKGSNLGKAGDGRLVIYWKDFASEEKGDYQTKIIQYTDLNKYNEFVFKQLKISIILGAVLGASLGWLIQNCYHQKSRIDSKKINEENNNLLDEKFQSINTKIDKLYRLINQKINNLTKSIKDNKKSPKFKK